MNSVILQDVKRSFGRKDVLRGVTAAAEEGKVVGLLGRNGEGKTTLMKLLMDMLAPNAGRIEVLGFPLDGSGSIRKRIGYVPERPAFHDFMTAAEVVELRSKFFPRWDKAKAAALARKLELDPGVRVRGASKGTLGKIAWICAAAHDPSLYLLDEPTSGLDALVREHVLSGLIEELHATGKTVLVTNHRMEEMASILDEIWVLAEGRISGVYNAERLRTQARRITGRLRPGAEFPKRMPILALESQAPLVQWVAFDAPSAEMVLRSDLLEAAETAPLSMETCLKYLLKENGGSHA